MLARSPLAAVSTVHFDRPVPLPLGATLAARLDAALTVLPRVAGFGIDPAVEALERPLGLADAGLVVRRVRLDDGRTVTAVTVPSTTWTRPGGHKDLLALKRAAGTLGRRVVLVPDAALEREPRAANAMLIAGCAGSPVSPSDRLGLMGALLEAGGSMPLADAADIMLRSDDPVAAILSLVAARVVGLDLREPIGPVSTVRSRRTRVRTAGARR